MNPRYAAAGLASLGRRGDSTLVHMAPREVAALDRLGAPMGHRITTNPDTGLPEAFGFLDILPMAAGLIAAPFVGPIGAALASGVTAGAKTAIQGGDPTRILTSAGLAGLGSYAGSGIFGAGTDAAMAAAGMTTEPAASAAEMAALEAPNAASQVASSLPVPPIPPSSPSMLGSSPSIYSTPAGPPTSALSGLMSGELNAGQLAESGIGNMSDKINAIASQPGAFAKGALGYIQDKPLSLIGAAAPMLINTDPTKQQPTTSQKPTLRPGFGQPWQQTYNPMPEGYNPGLQGPWDYGFTYNPPVVPGPLNIASGGEIKGMAEGGMASIDPVNLDPLSRLSQNISQNRNANWGADANWGLTAQNQPSGSLATALSSATQPSLTSGSTLSPGVPIVPGVPGSGVQIGVGKAVAPQVGQFDNSTSGTTAEGSSGGDTGEASKAGGVVRDGHIRRYFDGGYIQQNVSGFPADAPGLTMQRNMAGGGGVSTRNTVSEAIRALSGEHPDADGALKNFSDTFGPGALAALKNKYGGGRIRGPGGGLDDLVGGTIEGKQEVRLADGEFVVPADVVSGLGGGSTDKGVHELKNMMNRIRKGATGKTTQIKRVNPRKVLPA